VKPKLNGHGNCPIQRCKCFNLDVNAMVLHFSAEHAYEAASVPSSSQSPPREPPAQSDAEAAADMVAQSTQEFREALAKELIKSANNMSEKQSILTIVLDEIRFHPFSNLGVTEQKKRIALIETALRIIAGSVRRRRRSFAPFVLPCASDTDSAFGTSLGTKISRLLQKSSKSVAGVRGHRNQTPSSRGSMVSPCLEDRRPLTQGKIKFIP